MFQCTDADREKYLRDKKQRLLEFGRLNQPTSARREHPDQSISKLRDQGFVHLERFYPTALIEDINQQVDTIVHHRRPLSSVRNYAEEVVAADGTTKPVYFSPEQIQNYSGHLRELTSSVQIKDPLLQLHGLVDVIFDQRILELACAYFDSVPLMTFAKVKTTFVSDIPEVDTQLFHVDIGSYKILKCILYLHDVTDGGGPFSYVLGSHRTKFEGWESKSRHRDQDLRRHFAQNQFIDYLASSSDVALVETTGFHKGTRPTKADRNVLIFNFCVHPEYGLPTPKIKIRQRDRNRLSPLARAISQQLVEVTV